MRRQIRSVVVVLLVVAVVLAYALAFRPWWRIHRAEAFMARYAAERDERVAQKLADLLDQQSVPPDLGNRILKLLMMPEVTVRDAYGSDRPVYIAVRYPFPFTLRRTQVYSTEFFYAGGEQQQGSEGGACTSHQPRCHEIRFACLPDGSVRQTNAEGVYTASIRYTHVVIPGNSVDTNAALYRCEFEIPITIRVVAPQKAEPIRLVSNPSLNEQMKTAIRLEVEPSGGSSWSVGEVRIEMKPTCRFTYLPLPENVAFRATYRDESGLEIPLPEFLLLQRAGRTWGTRGSTWSCDVSFAWTDLPEGQRKGTVVLTPDVEAAYRDPEIKTLYSGTLEFPIEFEVRRTK